MKFRSVASVIVGALVATVLVAAPSSADPAVVSLECSAIDGASRDVWIDATVAGLADGESVSARVRVFADDGAAYDVQQDLTATSHLVAAQSLPSTGGALTFQVLVEIAGVETWCANTWAGTTLASFAIPVTVAAGKPVTLTPTFNTAANRATFHAVLQSKSSSGWKNLATSEIAVDGSTSFTFTPSHWRWMRVKIVEDEGSTAGVFSTSEFVLNALVSPVKIASKPSFIVKGQTGSLVVNYGGYATAGTAALQYKTSTGKWSTVKSAAMSQGDATIAWKPSATHTYRVAVTPTGGSAKYSPTFSVTVKPVLGLKGPSSVKKNATATFALTQYLAPPYYAYLQKWSGSKWVNVKKFVVGNTVQTVTAKVTATSKWRVIASTHASNSITVKVK